MTPVLKSTVLQLSLIQQIYQFLGGIHPAVLNLKRRSLKNDVHRRTVYEVAKHVRPECRKIR